MQGGPNTPSLSQTSYCSIQAKGFSCNFGAAVEQQTAGNVGGFNKKWVSLCIQNQLRFPFYADYTAQNELVHPQSTILPIVLSPMPL